MRAGTATRRRVGDGMALVSLLLLIGGIATVVVAEPASLVTYIVTGLGLVGGFGAVGWVLVRRLPDNPIGWSFSIAGLLWGTMVVAHGLAALALSGRVELGSFARGCALLDTWGWMLSVPFSVSVPLLLLPNGRLLSRRWRPVVVALLVGVAVGTIGFVTQPGPIDAGPPYGNLVNPLGVDQLGWIPMALFVFGAATNMLGAVAGVVAITVRFRRSRESEHQQLRWVVLGGCLTLVGIAASLGSGGNNAREIALWIVMVAGITALPVCVGVAVLRYRLYDLGRLVSRTASYAVVTALLLGVYLTLVTTSTQLLPDGSSLAVAASTLAAAALFQPLRRRVQTLVDRRFNRARYDADRTAAAFTVQLRQEVDLDTVRSDLLTVVHQALEPSRATIWLRGDTR